MIRQAWIGAFLITVIMYVPGFSGEPGCCGPTQDSFLKRLHPAGGWNPYGGGLLHWWNLYCIPRCGAPDDYCRKPLPRVCWPPYPSYYIWGPPEICCAQSTGCDQADAGRSRRPVK
jgi:hypothetical protein